MGFLDRFRCQMTIVASPEVFRFVTKTHDVPELPLLRVQRDGRILAVGEDAHDATLGGTLVHLFERPDDSRDRSWFDAVASTRFFMYHFALATDGKLLKHPLVTIQGVRRFHHLFDGNEVDIFFRLLKGAGAARVEFAEI